MDRTIPHRELRNNSSAILREVQSGAVIRVTNHGEVVAVMTAPADRAGEASRVRPASIRGGFEALPGIQLDHPIQTILDDLRGER